MTRIITLFCIFITQIGFSQSAESYLEKIRNNEALLTAFFQQMPKGGDLHHHFSGSIYAEPLLERAIAEDFYLNLETMAVSKTKPEIGDWHTFSSLKNEGKLAFYEQQVMQTWSVKDYNGSVPSDDQFFDSFMKFEPAIKGHFAEGMLELKKRAIAENVSYIETQLSTIPCDMNVSDLNDFNAKLRQASGKKDEKAVLKLLDELYKSLQQKDAKKIC
jgi:adenosine deaminase/adenosine deaminase CECR1